MFTEQNSKAAKQQPASNDQQRTQSKKWASPKHGAVITRAGARMHACMHMCVCVCALTFCVRCVIVCASRAALMRISSSRTRRSSRSAVVCCLQREREEREGEGGKRVCVCVCGKCTTQRLARQTSSFERRAWSSSCALIIQASSLCSNHLAHRAP